LNITLWGTRGSLASPGPETARYGGNTACIEVRGADGTLIVVDAGTGIRRLGRSVTQDVRRLDILLTHLHMDHIQGLGFFEPIFRPGLEVHIWGPASTTQDLGARLGRYLSPPLFPVRLRELPCRLTLHDVPAQGTFETGGLRVETALVCHPGPTVGFRIGEGSRTLTYLADHEPALGARRFPMDPEWMSGYRLAEGADILIHDCQYTEAEYPEHIGWGHSSIPQALTFAAATNVKRLVTFHHDPAHDDVTLDRLVKESRRMADWPFQLVGGTEGSSFHL
jgi:phosphoribosyl 1,2-cyclic phosphodiesterase